MIDFLLDLADAALGFLFRTKRTRRYVPSIGEELTSRERLALSRAWREWARDLGLSHDLAGEHVEGEAQGFAIEVHRRFPADRALRVVAHARGVTGVDAPIALARGKDPPPEASAGAREMLVALCRDAPSFDDLTLEEGAATVRLAPRAPPRDLETCLILIAESRRAGANTGTYRG